MTVGDRDLGHALLSVARCAIGAQLGLQLDTEVQHAALQEPGATFVTLRQRDELRGCIGSLEATRPLGVDVRENAQAAAFRDPRFPPLALGEFSWTTIEVSLLSVPHRMSVVDEDDLLAQLRPGLDGIVLECGGRRATFLPQVWDTFAAPREFIAALKRKAGWVPGFWSPEMSVSRYGVVKWAETEFAASETQQ